MLEHPNIIAFISHCGEFIGFLKTFKYDFIYSILGLNSVNEAMIAGVPIVCVPILGWLWLDKLIFRRHLCCYVFNELRWSRLQCRICWTTKNRTSCWHTWVSSFYCLILIRILKFIILDNSEKNGDLLPFVHYNNFIKFLLSKQKPFHNKPDIFLTSLW